MKIETSNTYRIDMDGSTLQDHIDLLTHLKSLGYFWRFGQLDPLQPSCGLDKIIKNDFYLLYGPNIKNGKKITTPHILSNDIQNMVLGAAIAAEKKFNKLGKFGLPIDLIIPFYRLNYKDITKV